MAPTKLKIGPLQDKTPVKLSIAADPDLHADLQDYARVYALSYGTEADVQDLIPSMLASFLASDAGFKRARKTLPTSHQPFTNTEE